MTSYSESFGLVLIEAMSYKIPCIAFDSASGAVELLKKNVGVLIKNRNKEDMAKEIIKILKSNKDISKYSQASFNKCQEFLLDNVKEKWYKLLNMEKLI
jgi:glycosyltransferase involved in cell wall biosynthesis